MSKNEDLLHAPTASELEAVGVRVRPGSTPESRNHDPLERFLLVPNHAMFLFTSEDSLIDSYIREHWAALDGLTGEYCDIHISLFQLSGGEDVYTQLEEIRSIPGLQTIKPTDLPALHIWSADSNCTIPLSSADTKMKLTQLFRSIFTQLSDVNSQISNEHATLLLDIARGHPAANAAPLNGQTVQNSTAGRDIIQVTQIYQYGHTLEEMQMGKPETRAGATNTAQIIEDVKAGKKISQSSDSATDSQTLRRAETPGAIAQKKSATAEMSFGWGKAKGAGIIGLVVCFVAWLAYMAYKYLVVV